MLKPILKNNDEITDYIVRHSSDELDEEFILEYFDGCKAILKNSNINCLIENDLNSNLRSSKKEKYFKTLSIVTMPPLVVKNNLVLDGNHRLRILKDLDVKIVSIYDIVLI